jgi:uncharacterized BrkB/YihY/UPF0761 family membrane protein
MEWNMKQNNLYFLITMFLITMFLSLCFYQDPNAPPPNTEFAAIGSFENPSI